MKNDPFSALNKIFKIRVDLLCCSAGTAEVKKSGKCNRFHSYHPYNAAAASDQ